jgi:hypothetical protein
MPVSREQPNLPWIPIWEGSKMIIKEVIQSQYLASLEMLKNAIIRCPESIWTDPEPKNKFWHIAFHSLFYTHLYLQPVEKDFTPYKSMGHLPWEPDDQQRIREPYTRDEVLAYLEFCQEEVKQTLPRVDLDSDESGFYWLPFNKLELQFYNIRHLQLHTGELCERLGTTAGVDVDWVGMVHGL